MAIKKNLFKEFIVRFIYPIFLREKASNETMISYLRKKGITIGEDVRIFNTRNTIIDTTKPSLLTIGSHVQITDGVKILTHGYDWYVLNGVYGDILGSAGEVHIGDNVFIGMNSIILKDVNIGDNVIIGAGSIVTKNIPSNSVVAGNPARVISTLEDYYSKRVHEQKKEALTLYKSYKRRYGTPPKNYFHEFFWLFESSSDGTFDEESFNYEMRTGGNDRVRVSRTLNRYLNSSRCFANFSEFCKWCEESEELSN